MKHQIPIALCETLDSVVSPDVRDALLAQALREADACELPTDALHFRTFTDGPLRRALVQGLGLELAEAVIEELDRVADLLERHSGAKPSPRRSSVSSQLRAVTPPRRSSRPPPLRSLSPRPGSLRSLPHALGTPPPWSGPITKPPMHSAAVSGSVPRPIDRLSTPPAPSPVASLFPTPQLAPSATYEPPLEGPETRRSIPYVLVVSKDATMIRRLTSWLDPHAALVRVHNVSGLVHSLEDIAHARAVILMDCRAPSIRATALAALADEIPMNVQVALWGATAELQRTLLMVSARTSEWVVYKGETRPKEIAERCFGLVS